MTVVSISMTACQTTSSCEWRLILIGSVSVDCLCGAVQWPGALLHVCPGHHTPIFHVRHPKRARHISSDAIRGKLALRPIYFTIKWILHQSWEFNKKFQTPWQSKSSTQNRFQRRTVDSLDWFDFCKFCALHLNMLLNHVRHLQLLDTPGNLWEDTLEKSQCSHQSD